LAIAVHEAYKCNGDSHDRGGKTREFVEHLFGRGIENVI
jgi:hypothetical protein